MRVRVLRYLGLLTAVAIAAGLGASPAETQGPRKGGVLRVGMIGEPPTLDGHSTTAVITREIAVNIFEGLYALDAKYQPVPLLAEGHEVLDGGKRYAIRLRKDVKFHNGKTLTSADVVASLKRWGSTAGRSWNRICSRASTTSTLRTPACSATAATTPTATTARSS